jgi:hypothetical protein
MSDHRSEFRRARWFQTLLGRALVEAEKLGAGVDCAVQAATLAIDHVPEPIPDPRAVELLKELDALIDQQKPFRAAALAIVEDQGEDLEDILRRRSAVSTLFAPAVTTVSNLELTPAPGEGAGQGGSKMNPVFDTAPEGKASGASKGKVGGKKKLRRALPKALRLPPAWLRAIEGEDE